MQVDVDPFKKAYPLYVYVADVNVVEISEEIITGNLVKLKETTNCQRTDVEMVTNGHVCNNEVVTEDQYAEKIKVAYPKAEEDLIDFLNRCKISNSVTMLSPRCSAVFDKEAAKVLKAFDHSQRGKENVLTIGPNSVSIKGVYLTRFYPQRNIQRKIRRKLSPHLQSLRPKNGCFPMERNLGTLLHLQNGSKELLGMLIKMRHLILRNMLKRIITREKNPMTKTQWSRFQCQNKSNALIVVTNTDKEKGK